MKSTPSELISTLRKKIALSTTILLAAIMIAIILFIFLDIPFLPDNSAVIAVLVGIGFYFFKRRVLYMDILRNEPGVVLKELETYLEEQSSKSTKNRLIRFGFVAIVMIILIFLLIYSPDNEWIPWILILLVAILIMSHIDSWYLMKDRMMAQDIKRCIREHQTSLPE